MSFICVSALVLPGPRSSGESGDMAFCWWSPCCHTPACWYMYTDICRYESIAISWADCFILFKPPALSGAGWTPCSFVHWECLGSAAQRTPYIQLQLQLQQLLVLMYPSCVSYCCVVLPPLTLLLLTSLQCSLQFGETLCEKNFKICVLLDWSHKEVLKQTMLRFFQGWKCLWQKALYKISKVLVLISKGCNFIKHIGITYC